MAQLLLKAFCQFLKKLNTVSPNDLAISFLSTYPPQKDLNRSLYENIHCSIIHNSQNVEVIQVSIDGWMWKQNMVYPNKGILLSHEKEWSSDSRYNLDES